MLEEISTISEARIGKRGSCGHDWRFERELVLEEDLKVEFMDGFFHLLAHCFVGCIRDGGLIDLKLSTQNKSD